MKNVMRRKAHHERSSKRTAQLRPQVSERSRRGAQTELLTTSDLTYEIVQHDGGWAYKVNGVFSEAFPSHAEALAAAQFAAAEQQLPGDAETIEYEDDRGEWHGETVSGRDRPHVWSRIPILEYRYVTAASTMRFTAVRIFKADQ